jgi:hypothetical protein
MSEEKYREDAERSGVIVNPGRDAKAKHEARPIPDSSIPPTHASMPCDFTM